MHRAKRAHRTEPTVYDLCGRDGTPSASEAGLKAHNLIRMAALGLPVPQGFVLGTDWCRAARSVDAVEAQLSGALQTGIGELERKTGLGFGSARRPLLLSVRSGAPVSMPGMLETVLSVGLNDATLDGFLQLSGDHRLVWDSYRRLIQSFAEVVAGVPAAAFGATLDTALRASGVDEARQLGYRALRELSRAYLDLHHEHTGRDFPQDPFAQLAAATRAVFASWNSPKAVEYRRLYSLSDQVGTAVTIQRMVFGNAGGNSGAGVGFTRDPSTGENRLYLDWLPRAQGEDIVSGRCRVTPEAEVPRWLLQRLADVSESLEKSFGDAQEFEFTVENGVLFMLQTRHAKRTPMAALRIAVEQMESGMLGPGDALRRLDAIDLDSIASNRVESDAPPIGRAVPAGIGVASGPAAFTRDAVEACAKHGTPAIFVRNDIATGDIAGIALAGGVLTAGGSRTSHAAVVARQMGKVCLVGCAGLAVDERARHATLGDAAICEGDPLCIDGSTGDIFTGTPRVVSERPVALIKRLKEWRHNAA